MLIFIPPIKVSPFMNVFLLSYSTDNNKTDSWSERCTGSENVNNRLASNKCDNSQSFLIKIFFERFWKVGLKANIVRLIHNYK